MWFFWLLIFMCFGWVVLCELGCVSIFVLVVLMGLDFLAVVVS